MTGVRRPAVVVAALAALTLAACGDGDTDSAEPDEETVTSGDVSPADCPPVDGTEDQVRQFDAAPPDCLEPGATYEAVVTTNKGEFTIELDPVASPVATNNFVFLTRHRYYDDTECHRIIPDFVVQCGDPTATGTGGPGYTIADEPPAPGAYQLGSIAMARTPAPDSAGSQFFIVTGASGTALPPEYALFGQVVDGYESTVTAMAAAGTPGAGVPSEPIRIESVTIDQR
jgi:cyclophilin family peptidyl-prolyl cis-trans isomerase